MMMKQQQIIEDTRTYVKSVLQGEGSGHDWWHIVRVVNNAMLIGKGEGADMFVVELAALLHDVGDQKLHGGDESVGPRMTRDWLEKMEVAEATIKHIVAIVNDLSYKGANVATPMSTIEGKVVQDGDRLDAIGAIGIARTFAYGGHKNHLMYDPNVPTEMHDSFEKYKNSTAPTINHFYEKLLLLKDLMNTASAKAIAAQRHEYMETYLQQFFAEWNGER
jgi:uncharacterized protein